MPKFINFANQWTNKDRILSIHTGTLVDNSSYIEMRIDSPYEPSLLIQRYTDQDESAPGKNYPASVKCDFALRELLTKLEN